MFHLVLDPRLINYAASSIRFSAQEYYFNYCITRFTPEWVQNYFKTMGVLNFGSFVSAVKVISQQVGYRGSCCAEARSCKRYDSRTKIEQHKFNNIAINPKFVAYPLVLINNFQFSKKSQNIC